MTGEPKPDVSGAANDEGRREIEWQLSAPDLGLVRRWLSDHGSVHGLTIEPRPTHTIDDTYLDMKPTTAQTPTGVPRRSERAQARPRSG